MNADIVQTWFEQSVGTKTVLLLTGTRGLGKRRFLEDLYLKACALNGQTESSLFLDFEDGDSQPLRTAEQMWHRICERVPTGRFTLFVNEGASFDDGKRFWTQLLASKRCSMVCVTSSNRRIFNDLPKGVDVSECHLCPEDAADEDGWSRSLWYEILLHDVMRGLRLANTRTLELMAKWLSDHMGEPVSLRNIKDDFGKIGYSISASTLNTYLKALQSAYFFERLDCWDALRWKVSPYDYCYFPVMLDMRKCLWGTAPTRESERMALARAYFRLRRSSGQDAVINTVRNGPHGADFATMGNDGMRLWRVACDGEVEQVFLS